MWFYISFAAEDGLFLGGLVIEAEDLVPALKRAHELGVNPGGEALAHILPTHLLPPEQFRNQLLSRSEIAMLWPDKRT